MKKTHRFFGLLVVFFSLTFIPLARAATAITPNDYGTGGSNFLMIPGSAFIPSDSTTGYAKPYLLLERTGGGGSEFTHELILPVGALIQSITAYVNDSSATNDVSLRLCIMATQAGSGTFQSVYCDNQLSVPPVSTSGTPGYTSLTQTPNLTFRSHGDIPFNAYDKDLSYIILVHLGATDSSNWLSSVRVTWKRQITPAPGTATFSDVPTSHPLFQFIEAMAASGITAGCSVSPPQYCPDAPVTRGQMAVFLARGLGLHWAQ